MAYGQVTWSNPVKGFGIIARQDGEAVFVHYSQVFGGDEPFLNTGDSVQFELIRGPSGLHAINVRVCSQLPDETQLQDETKPRPQDDRG